jgi:hypothetical protein
MGNDYDATIATLQIEARRIREALGLDCLHLVGSYEVNDEDGFEEEVLVSTGVGSLFRRLGCVHSLMKDGLIELAEEGDDDEG